MFSSEYETVAVGVPERGFVRVGVGALDVPFGDLGKRVGKLAENG